ncbi:hypothetical protein P691DRAFT_669437 [Macrolepiota fuliginosa MF-IS2]|uniref:Uncharacterized protein n=1 Tax=Macrolepiota fuliginosa MF-IS2 TaxID=1400762 RepID=A0A9P5XEQ1_9AGAR|nr:hypothetical protein P691DRAFT_669437 [Macrolepiota fuliginosa MF-IS2]
MLIQLLPTPPHPNVLFKITFDDLPDGLVLPQTWTMHLSNLMHDELPIPRFRHALDKASFLPCILEEVTFDIPAASVTCRFIDGSVEEWKIDLNGSQGRLGVKCLQTLECVVDDVRLSILEEERGKQREKEREREKEKERLKLLQQSSPSSSVKSTKHKKKRSLLMTIVSSLSSLKYVFSLVLRHHLN